MAEGVGQKTARALVDADVGVGLLSAKGGLEAALSMLKDAKVDRMMELCFACATAQRSRWTWCEMR